MRKVIFTLIVFVFSIIAGNKVKAQDFSSLEGSNYYLIWLDSDTEEEYDITSNTVLDLRPNWNYDTNPDAERALYIWESTYASNEPSGKGSFGQIGGFFDFTVTGAADWSGLGFCMRKESPSFVPVDFTAIQNDMNNYRFHMAIKSPNAKAHGIEVFGGDGVKAQFSVGVGTFEAAKPVNLTPGFTVDTWNVIDVPVSKLAELGWSARGAFDGNYFVILSGPASNRIMFDAVYFYKVAGSGINNPVIDNKLKVIVTKNIVEVLNASAPIEIYDLAGIKVKTSESSIFGTEELSKGAYIIKSGSAVGKVIIK